MTRISVLTLLSVSLLVPAACRAETRIIGVLVTRAQNKTQVSVFSDVAKENVRHVTVPAAAKVLKGAEGWGSSVIVGVQAHAVPLGEYLPVLDALSKNAWTELAFVEGRPPSFLDTNIRRKIAEMIAADRPQKKGR